MMRRWVYPLLFLTVFAACTRTPDAPAQVPTLAVLPSATPTPTATFMPLPTQTNTSTNTPSPTRTAVPTDTPTATPTLTPTRTLPPTRTPKLGVCSDSERPDALDWRSEISRLTFEISSTGVEADPQSALEIRHKMAAVPYPDCLSTARDHLLNSLQNMYYGAVSSDQATKDSYSQIVTAESMAFAAELNKALPVAEF